MRRFTTILLLITTAAQAQQIGQRKQDSRIVIDANVLIVYPRGDEQYAKLAQQLVSAIHDKSGVSLRALPDSEVMDKNDWRLRFEMRSRTLILLGNINNNRALLPLYA